MQNHTTLPRTPGNGRLALTNLKMEARRRTSRRLCSSCRSSKSSISTTSSLTGPDTSRPCQVVTSPFASYEFGSLSHSMRGFHGLSAATGTSLSSSVTSCRSTTCKSSTCMATSSAMLRIRGQREHPYTLRPRRRDRSSPPDCGVLQTAPADPL